MSQNSSDQEHHEQISLDLKIIISKEIDGVEMGVLNDGTPFLTGRGLARACGVSNSTIVDWGEFTPKLGDSLRAGKMAELLSERDFEGSRFFTRVATGIQFGIENSISAYPDSVCMAFLEYYAFEAGRHCTQEALNNFRILNRNSLRNYIYLKTGYDPMKLALKSWHHFHDRLLLNPVPNGYFSIFRETADMVLASIREGLEVDSHTVPDISVGSIWSKYWTTNSLDIQYGQRQKFPHIYPDYFPQARANDSIEAYIYPIRAAGIFKEWLQVEYLPQKYPAYIKRKSKEGAIAQTKAAKLLEALEPVRLNPSS